MMPILLEDSRMVQSRPERSRSPRRSPAGAIAARLTGSTEIGFFYDSIFVKEPRTARPSARHQDQVYYPVDGDQVVVLWLALDPSAAESDLRVVRGSHRRLRRAGFSRPLLG
jgi:ectoine hydroxylase-related dioxygenase (phytanoyl-CoA dioxygenase family)